MKKKIEIQWAITGGASGSERKEEELSVIATFSNAFASCTGKKKRLDASFVYLCVCAYILYNPPSPKAGRQTGSTYFYYDFLFRVDSSGYT